MPDTFSAHTDKLMADLRQIVKDAEQALSGMAEQTGEEAQELREEMGKRVTQAKHTLGRLQEQGSQQARMARTQTEAFVREHPLLTGGVAAGIGLVLGFLVARR